MEIKNEQDNFNLKKINTSSISSRDGNISNNTFNLCWEALGNFVLRNYQLGKATIIPRFGSFTYTHPAINLEGSTNQYERDKKAVIPVFIISNEFCENIRPGIYSEKGVTVYQDKANNSVPHLKLNYSELGLSLNMDRNDCSMIIDQILNFLRENIQKRLFKNKEIPNIGVLLLRNDILAVKFRESLYENVKYIPQQNRQTRKEVKSLPELKNDTIPIIYAREKNKKKENTNSLPIKIKNYFRNSLNNIKPNRTALCPNINYGEVNKKEEVSETEKILTESKFDKKYERLEDISLDTNLLKSIYFHKNLLIKEMKLKDINNKKLLGSHDLFMVFLKSNIEGLNHNHIKNIIQIYNPNNLQVEYLKFMDQFIGEISTVLQSSMKTISDMKKMSKSSSLINYQKMSVEMNVDFKEVKNEIRTIKSISSKLQNKFLTKIEQNITYLELINVLREYDIVYPIDKIIKILKYLDTNPENFKLKDFVSSIERSKIVNNDITSEDINNTKTKIKNILFTSEKSPEELYNIYSTNNQLSLKNFKEMVLTFSKDNLLNEFLIETLFLQLTTSNKIMSLEQFKNEFFKINNESFETKAIQKILEKMRQRNINIDEYFDIFISYKNIGQINGHLNKIDFQRALQIENFNFTLQEMSILFQIFDMKKDDVIDRDEWNTKLKTPSDPLYRIQDIIKKNCFDIEEIFYRMEIDINKNDTFDFNTFKIKIRLLDSFLEHSFITALFNKIKNSKETVDKKTIETYFNVYQKENLNAPYFKKNFTDHIKQLSSLVQLQSLLEKYDRLGNGLIDKSEFCKAIQTVTREYKEDEILKFVRISDLFKGHQKVKYPEFLELVFYDDQINTFNSILSVLKKQFYNANYNLMTLVREITGKVDVNKNFIEISEMHNYLKLFIKDVNRSIVCKLDVDQDGRISILDLKTILEKYSKTNYFKYDNNDDNLELNLSNKEVLDENKFKLLVKNIKSSLKQKNMTVLGLFKMLDTNGDGMVTISEFNHNIDNFLMIAPHIKDMFFNYLDNRKVGMIDYNTFKIIFKDYTSEERLTSNDWETENRIINEFKKWINNNKHLNEIEIFYFINKKQQDKIEKDEFTQFIINNLLISKSEVNNHKVERVLSLISISKNKFLNINDIRQFISKVRSSSTDSNFFKTAVIFSKSDKDIKDNWVNEALEKLGYYLTDVFTDLEKFFKKYNGDSETMTLDKFKEFFNEHYNCLEGFNLTEDEVSILFSSIDSHKKGSITLIDLKTKLEKFNFYDKMHSEIKFYLRSSFTLPKAAYVYFLNQTKDNQTLILNDNKENLTLKEIFEGINNLFPKKYSTNQVLNYIKLIYKNSEKITFSEFSYVYYDLIVTEQNLMKKNDILSKSATNFRKKNNSLSSTPLDEDPFDKLRRILKSSRYDSREYFKIYQLLNDGKLNNNEFINMIKRLNLGFTLLEINYILSRLEKNKDGLVYLKDFLKFLNYEYYFSYKLRDQNLKQVQNTLRNSLTNIKQLIIKYYTQPIICFQFNDPKSQGKIDFETFKIMINDLYFKENTNTQLSHLSIKSLFDYIDIRKDGVIDQNEWLKTFGMTQYSTEKNQGTRRENISKDLRQWENSKDITYLFNIFAKNRRLIKDSCRNFTINSNLIKAENLIKILRDLFPQIRLSNTQWKILVSIGDKTSKDEVKLDIFFEIMNNSSKQNLSHMKI